MDGRCAVQCSSAALFPAGLTIQIGAAQNASTYVVIRQSPALQAIQD